jgi:hypothetical protein
MAQSNLEYFVKNEFSKNQYPSIWPQNGPTKFDLKKISFQLQQLKKKFTKNKKVLT